MNQTENKTKKEVYLVEGMHCSGCENTVGRVIASLPGVKSAKADLGSASVSLEYDPSKVTVDQVKEAVGKFGYKIVGERAPEGRREGSDEAVS
jgi:copper chaperone CopZ